MANHTAFVLARIAKVHTDHETGEVDFPAVAIVGNSERPEVDVASFFMSTVTRGVTFEGESFGTTYQAMNKILGIAQELWPSLKGSTSLELSTEMAKRFSLARGRLEKKGSVSVQVLDRETMAKLGLKKLTLAHPSTAVDDGYSKHNKAPYPQLVSAQVNYPIRWLWTPLAPLLGKNAGTEDKFAEGSGSFEQTVTHGQTVTVGEIPAGLNGIHIALKCRNDVDIELYDKKTGKAIVAWNQGKHALIDSPTKKTVKYKGMTITYSGFNGDGTGLGHEYITIEGEISQRLVMKAYGYRSGEASVNYEPPDGMPQVNRGLLPSVIYARGVCVMLVEPHKDNTDLMTSQKATFEDYTSALEDAKDQVQGMMEDKKDELRNKLFNRIDGFADSWRSAISERQSCEGELDDLKDELEQLKEELADAEDADEKDDLQDEKDDLEDDIDVAKTEYWNAHGNEEDAKSDFKDYTTRAQMGSFLDELVDGEAQGQNLAGGEAPANTSGNLNDAQTEWGSQWSKWETEMLDAAEEHRDTLKNELDSKEQNHQGDKDDWDPWWL